MNDAIIKKHNFSTAKNQIQEFSRRLPANPRFEEFEEDGIKSKYLQYEC